MSSLPRCLGCVRALARPLARPIARSPRPSFRPLHAFAPTPTLLKKKGTRAIDEAEFEEDVIEDDFDEPVGRPALASELSGAQQHALSPDERRARAFERHHAQLAYVLAKSAFALRSETPSASALVALFTKASSEDLPRAIETLALWHSKAIPIPSPEHLTSEIITRCATLKAPATAVAVLADRKTYGLDLAATPTAKIALLFASLRLNTAGATPEALARDAATLLALVELAKPTDGPSIRVAQVSTLAVLLDTADKVGVESQLDYTKKAHEILASVRKAGLETLVADGRAMTARPQGRYANAVQYLVSAFTKQGMANDAKLFADLLAVVKPASV